MSLTSRAFSVASWIVSAPIMSKFARVKALKALGVDMRAGGIQPGCVIQRRNVHFDGDVWLNNNVWFDAHADIWLGRGTMVGPGVRFLTGTHEIGPHELRASTPIIKDIRVGAGCFIGANVVVLPGVTIGDGVVIGAGSIVTKDCEPDSVYVGAPARKIKSLEGASL